MGVHLNKQEDHQMMILPFGREDVTRRLPTAIIDRVQRRRTRCESPVKQKRIAVTLSSCREDVTRTRDPYVPNVVRYQLRHFSVFAENLDYFFEIFSLTFGAFLKAAAKVQLFF